MIRSCLKRDNQLFWQIIDWSPMMIELVLKVFCIYIECFEGVLHEFYKDNLFFEFWLKEKKFKWCSLEEIIKSWFAVLPWISKPLRSLYYRKVSRSRGSELRNSASAKPIFTDNFFLEILEILQIWIPIIYDKYFEKIQEK